MRTRSTLVITAALALGACSDGPIVLDIDVGTTTATDVELVIAEQVVANQAIQGPAGLLPNATVWTRDSPVRTVAPVSGGHAKFEIQAGDQNATPTIVAIGFVGETAKGFVVVPSLPTRPGIYTATLAASTPSSVMDGKPHLDVWASGSTVRTGPVCISIVGDRAIVPIDDPDCDGFVAPNECPGADYIFRDNQPATVTRPRDASCIGVFDLSTSLGTNLGNTCRLGGTGCVDGAVTQQTTCQPAGICLPDAACTCPTLDLGCIDAAMFNPTSPSDVLIDCTVQLDVNGAICPNANVLPLRLANTSTRTCTRTAFMPLPLTQLGFRDVLEFPSSGAQYSASPNDGTCNVDLTLETAPAGGFHVERAIVDYRAGNSFDLLFPLRITYARSGDVCDPVNTFCLPPSPSTDSLLNCFASGAIP